MLHASVGRFNVIRIFFKKKIEFWGELNKASAYFFG